MCCHKTSRRSGFVLIEALVALLLISFGLLAIAGLQALSVSGAGAAKSRSEAVTLSQQKLEELRNIVVKAAFTGTPLTTDSATITGSNATYAMDWTVSPLTAGGLEQRLVTLRTTWTDSNGVQQTLDLNSVIAWDDPGLQGKLSAGLGSSLISPTGSAIRGGSYSGGGTETPNGDGSKIAVEDNNTTYLLDSLDQVILSLPPKADGTAQSFSTITGKIFFDQNAANNSIPNSANVRVRLSSEGECIYNSASNAMTSVSGGTNPNAYSYKYFTYTCYVGSGWYGNVGVLVDDSENGSAASPTICVGDPSFNGGASDNTLISVHPVESATRSYRGFKGSAGAYLSTGMGYQSDSTLWTGTKYGLSFNTTNDAYTGPFDGRPRPSAYPSSYASITANSANDYFEQNFLVTSVSGQATCNSKMLGDIFTRNAGKYVCINPDNDTSTDVCPSIWPGFEGEVGSGGTSYALSVIKTGTGAGTVASAPSGINCGSTCSASFASGTAVTLTAAATSGSSFAGWSGGGCSGAGTCTVTMSAAQSVTANFTSGVVLTVEQAGAGSGTVTSSPAGISCGATCAYGFTSGTSVTLTAVANSGSSFSGWSGGSCSGTGPCVVTMNSATSVIATYNASTTYTLSVTKAGTGSGTVTSSPVGISCGSTCSASFGSGSLVTLTPVAVGGSTFTSWGGSCSGTGACTVTMDQIRSVLATFSTSASCTTPISGSAYTSTGTVTASTGGTCAMGNGNTLNYSCSLSLPQGTVVTLTNSKTNGNANTHYTYSKQVTANCLTQTGVNFP